VRSPDATRLVDVLAQPDVSVERADDGSLEVTGLTAEQVGELAAAHAIVLHELTPVRASLEEAFMDVTRDELEYAAAAGAA
jgi:ABC-2 type transport system ATP-binding protein